MKPKNIFRGISNLFFGGLLAYSLNTGDVNAQSSPQNVMDSTVVEKTIPFKFNARDEANNAPLEGVGAEIYGKYSGEDIYQSFFNNNFYNFEGEIFTDQNGEFSNSFTINVFDKVATSVRDRGSLLPTNFRLGMFPTPYNPSTRALISVIKPGNYTYELYDEDGSLIGKKSAFLSSGNYEVELNSGAAGRDFFRVKGPDGVIDTYKGVNLGGGSSPFMKDISSSNYSIESSSLEKVLEKQGIYSTSNFDSAMDTLQIGWGKDGYWVESLDKIPLYGIFKNDTVKTTTPDGSSYDKIYVFGNVGSDTLKVLWNNNLSHTIILYGAKDGSSIDSVDFNIGLQKK